MNRNRTKRKPDRETTSKREPDPVLELKRLTIMQLKSRNRSASGGQTQWCAGCY